MPQLPVEEHVETEPIGELTLKGLQRPIPAFNVVALKAPVTS